MTLNVGLSFMKDFDPSIIQLLHNRSIFEEIHQVKTSFISLFSDLANEISTHELLEVHEASQGIKITKGNELQHCPYQVLDIIRDFDKDKGFNIRIMNWWGRGMFVFVFLGKNNSRTKYFSNFVLKMKSMGFMLSKTSSPWDYKNMIDRGYMETIDSVPQFERHLEQFKYIQFVDKIDYSENFHSLKLNLKEYVFQILKFYGE